MNGLSELLSPLQSEVRRKVAPVLYKVRFSPEQRLRNQERLDSLTNGLISLLDANPTEIKRKLGLDEKQMRELLLLGKLASEKRLTRNPVKLQITAGQQLLSVVYEGNRSQFFEDKQGTLASALDILTKDGVRLAIYLNSSSDLPVSAGIWGRKGTSKSDSVHFLFLPEKPITKDQSKVKGSSVDSRLATGWDVDIFGRGERIDFTYTYNKKGQTRFLSDSFLYLGEFEWESGSGAKLIHCWGHNTKTHTKSMSITQRANEPLLAPQPSEVIA